MQGRSWDWRSQIEGHLVSSIGSRRDHLQGVGEECLVPHPEQCQNRKGKRKEQEFAKETEKHGQRGKASRVSERRREKGCKESWRTARNTAERLSKWKLEKHLVWQTGAVEGRSRVWSGVNTQLQQDQRPKGIRQIKETSLQ